MSLTADSSGPDGLSEPGRVSEPDGATEPDSATEPGGSSAGDARATEAGGSNAGGTDPAFARMVARRLVDEPPRAGGSRVLAIDGPSGSGKSVLAQALRAELGEAPVVRLDDVYPGWDGLRAGIDRVRHHVLEPFAAGAPVRHPRFDWAVGADAGWVERPDTARAGVLILEGVGAGALVCAPFLSLLVWLDAPVRVRFRRAMDRDGEAYRSHWSRWAAQEAEYFAADDPAARAAVVLETAALDTPARPDTTTRPDTSERPDTATRPGTATRPDTAEQPDTATRPGTTTRPGAARGTGISGDPAGRSEIRRGTQDPGVL